MFEELVKKITIFKPSDLDGKTLQMGYVESEGQYVLFGRCVETGRIYIFESNVVKVK